MNQTDYYDKRAIYNKEIKKIIKDLKLACNIEKMPMFVTVAVKNDKDTTDYESDMILASTGVSLTENQITKLLLSLNGFNIEPPDYIKKDIKELEDYLNMISFKRSKKNSKAGIKLTSDHIFEFDQLVTGKEDVRPPITSLEKNITDEFLDD